MTRIEALARRYVESRDEIARLRDERDGCHCEFEPALVGGAVSPPARERDDGNKDPCWKWYPPTEGHTERHASTGELIPAPGDVGYRAGDEGGWCAACLRRQEIHEQLRAAQRLLPGRLSALISHTRATVGPKRAPKARPAAPSPAPAPPTPMPWFDDDIPY